MKGKGKMQVKAKFVELLEKSTITQSYITIAVITTACITWGMGVEMSEGLQAAVMIVLGFFFGSKAATMRQKG